MTDQARIKVAASVTALFLAGISAAGLASRRHEPAVGDPAPAAVTVQQPEAAPVAQLTGYSAREDGDERHEVASYEEHEDDG